MNTAEVREELYRSLGMASDDSLMNENEWVDDDSYYSLNNDVHLDEDNEEVENNEEHILGDELEEYDVNGEPYDTFTEEDVSVGPISGMQFKDENSLFALYKEHARLKGFSIVKRNSKKIAAAKYLTYCCDRARNRKVKYTTKSNNCKARITAIVDSYGFWRVSKVFNDHNHELLPAIARFMAGHRSISQSLKRDLVAHDRSGIRPSKNIRHAEVQRGGPQNLGCTPKDCRNFILKSRNFEMQERDAQSLLNFFHEMQIKDREFFYSIDVDNSGRLQNVVWVHSHCKAAYEHFHDAICFDTTYLVNRYNMPCASFVGINHHRQSILLRCALMSHEDIVSYKLIRTWLEAMGNVHPNAIITDQCPSIKPAIAEVMPHTVHRYCIWHIFSKLPLYLSGLPNSKIAHGEFKSMILDSISVENFEIRWAEYIEKYDLQTRDWFNKLYIEKEKWVPAYLDVFFWAGMLSTQRSEGMHAFFDGFISRQSTLKLFVHQYELAIRAKHEKELEAEYRSKGFHIISESLFKWEEQVIQCYTRTVYEFFKTQLRKLYHCEVSTPADHEAIPGVEKFIIRDYSIMHKNGGNPVEYTIEYRPIGSYFSCSCKWFESRGILCCHILKIFSHKKIDKIDERYILTRWRRDIIRPHLNRFFLGGYPNMTVEYKTYRSMLMYFDQDCDIALGTDVKVHYVKYNLKRIVHDLQNWTDEMIVADPDLDDTDQTEGTILRDPQYIRSRGRPHTTRSRGRMEYYFPSSQPHAGFGASNGGRTGVRGGGRTGVRGGGRVGGRGGGRVGGRGGRGGGGNRGGRGSRRTNQIDATLSQRTFFDLNIDPNLDL